MPERKSAGPGTGHSGERDDGIVIETSDLRKEFGDLVAVESLDLCIPRGVLYGLIGPNGSGKTTAIKMLVGLLRQTAGTAWVLGEEIPLRAGKSKMGYMPQEQAIYPDLTVYENLELFSGLYGMRGEEFEGSAEALLQMVDLGQRRDTLVGELSGGMKHRTSLACTLVHDPTVMFLDEPTVGVDPELRSGFWRYFSDLKSRQKTIVLTTHYMDEAVRCDVVGMMRRGALMAEGTPQELMDATSSSSLEDAFMAYARRADG